MEHAFNTSEGSKTATTTDRPVPAGEEATVRRRQEQPEKKDETFMVQAV